MIKLFLTTTALLMVAPSAAHAETLQTRIGDLSFTQDFANGYLNNSRRNIMHYVIRSTIKVLSLMIILGMSIVSLPASAKDRTALDNDVHAAITCY